MHCIGRTDNTVCGFCQVPSVHLDCINRASALEPYTMGYPEPNAACTCITKVLTACVSKLRTCARTVGTPSQDIRPSGWHLRIGAHCSALPEHTASTSSRMSGTRYTLTASAPGAAGYLQRRYSLVAPLGTPKLGDTCHDLCRRGLDLPQRCLASA